MRTLVSCVVIAAAVGCGGGGTTPTAPTALPLPPPIVSSRCTPSSSARIHTVPVPDAATPVTVWIERTTPPPGSAVRVGDIAQVAYAYLTPPGFTTLVQSFVGDESTRGFFASVTTGGCGSGLSATPVPRTNGPLRVWLRVWISPGTFRAGERLPDTQRPPDYEASELMDWTVVP